MIADSVKFKGYRCFDGEFSGFDEIKPVNVIIGRNNTGKSHLLKLAEFLCRDSFVEKGVAYRCSGTLQEGELKGVFRPSTSQGALQGNHWSDHGHLFVGKKVWWEIDKGGNATEIEFEAGFDPASRYGKPSTEARLNSLRTLLRNSVHSLKGRQFRRLLADRDIQPEAAINSMALDSGGDGATNLVRQYILSSKLDRSLIQKDLLAGLNQIFQPDATFTEIQVQVHEGGSGGQERWEIFLGEESKDLIALSESGSGLKTIFLVLLNLLVVPGTEKKSLKSYAFAFEELENNLHPALLRRLFSYLEKRAVEEGITLFLTTHSNVALDIFGTSENAQIIRVMHDGKHATAEKVSSHFERFAVVSELGLKPSDLLQANGIIWVEGPSDRVYLNRWIHLLSNGEFEEGRDYQCAFYGGALLARVQFKSEEEAEEDLVNLIRVNPNVVVICDSDKTGPNTRVKGRVRRISSEIRKIPGAYVWVTAAREIENYVPGDLIAKACGRDPVLDPQQFEHFFPRKGLKSKSYIERRLGRKTLDKMELASSTAPLMEIRHIEGRFDLKKEVEAIIERIRGWNRE